MGTRCSARWAGYIGHDVLDVWARVEPFIKDAIAAGHLPYTPEDVAANVMDRRWQLWTVFDDDGIMAVVVTEIQEYGNGKVGTILFLAGEEMGRWRHLLDDVLFPWFREKNCKRVRFFGRKGWLRVFPDWELSAYVMTKEL